MRSTVKVVIVFLDVVFVENDRCLTFISWKDSDFFDFFLSESDELVFAFLRGCFLVVSTRLVLALMLSASAIGRYFTTVSTLATMSFVGIFFGVTERFKPFSRRSFSCGGNILVERFDYPFGFVNCDLVLTFCYLLLLILCRESRIFFSYCHFSEIGFVVEIM